MKNDDLKLRKRMQHVKLVCIRIFTGLTNDQMSGGSPVNYCRVFSNKIELKQRLLSASMWQTIFLDSCSSSWSGLPDEGLMLSDERESLQDPETSAEVVNQEPLGSFETPMQIPPTPTWTNLNKAIVQAVFSSEVVASPGCRINRVSHKDLGVESKHRAGPISRPVWQLTIVTNSLGNPAHERQVRQREKCQVTRSRQKLLTRKSKSTKIAAVPALNIPRRLRRSYGRRKMTKKKKRKSMSER